MGIVWVYMTAADKAEAETIGKSLVESNLAACVNIVDGMQSVYRWEGEVQQAREAILIAKTTEEQLDGLKDRVVSLHSYDCPCILALPVCGGHAPFTAWIEAQAAPKAPQEGGAP